MFDLDAQIKKFNTAVDKFIASGGNLSEIEDVECADGSYGGSRLDGKKYSCRTDAVLALMKKNGFEIN